MPVTTRGNSNRWTDQASITFDDCIVIVPVLHEGVVHYVRQWWRLPFMSEGGANKAGYAWDTICRVKEWHYKPEVTLGAITCLSCLTISIVRANLFAIADEWGNAC